jgi:hypothetical protein
MPEISRGADSLAHRVYRQRLAGSRQLYLLRAFCGGTFQGGVIHALGTKPRKGKVRAFDHAWIIFTETACSSVVDNLLPFGWR